MLRVRIEPRDACISDMVCVALCNEVFEISVDDGKSQVRSEWRLREDLVGEGRVPDDLRVCVEAAAENCPVSIIHFEEEPT